MARVVTVGLQTHSTRRQECVSLVRVSCEDVNKKFNREVVCVGWDFD